MNVLQAAASVIRGGRSKQFAILLIPNLRHVAHRQLARHQTALNAKAQQDVQIIRRLVRFHADEAEFRAQQLLHERIQPHLPQMREEFLRPRQPLRPKRAAAAHMILPQTALRFMDAQ